MKDIDLTAGINEYRECTRNLWNTYFIEKLSVGNEWDLKDKFDEICTLIFTALVLIPINQSSFRKAHSYEKQPESLPFIRVVPLLETGVPIQINRSMPCSGYWDYPLDIIRSLDFDLRFIDFFDFDLLSFRDLQYCRVRIVGSATYPEIVGHDALLESNKVKFLFVEQSKEDLGG